MEWVVDNLRVSFQCDERKVEQRYIESNVEDDVIPEQVNRQIAPAGVKFRHCNHPTVRQDQRDTCEKIADELIEYEFGRCCQFCQPRFRWNDNKYGPVSKRSYRTKDDDTIIENDICRLILGSIV